MNGAVPGGADHPSVVISATRVDLKVARIVGWVYPTWRDVHALLAPA